jgi:transcriptional regulator of arginine metabolism
MKNKSERLLSIRKHISNDRVTNQEELLKLLEKDGYSMTQATLSRDLKYLRVSKMYDAEKGYVYFLPEAETNETFKLSGFLAEGFVSYEFANGMMILRTYPGYASSIASAIDANNIVEIAGTIAGDDTILLIPRDGSSRKNLVKQLSVLIPGIKQ